DQRQWLSSIAARNEELVATRTRRAGVGMLAELGSATGIGCLTRQTSGSCILCQRPCFVDHSKRAFDGICYPCRCPLRFGVGRAAQPLLNSGGGGEQIASLH